MKNNSVWVGVSATILTALANGSTSGQFLKPDNKELTYQKTLPAIRVWINSDGSAHLIDRDGNVTYLNPQALEFLKKVNPGSKAILLGTDCFGN